MASVDIEDASFSESSDLQKARKLYAELQAMSMESTGSTEVGIHAFIYLELYSNYISVTRICLTWMQLQENSTMRSGLCP